MSETERGVKQKREKERETYSCRGVRGNVIGGKRGEENVNEREGMKRRVR